MFIINRLYYGKIEDIVLPEKVDVIVSEWMVHHNTKKIKTLYIYLFIIHMYKLIYIYYLNK